MKHRYFLIILSMLGVFSCHDREQQESAVQTFRGEKPALQRKDLYTRYFPHYDAVQFDFSRVQDLSLLELEALRIQLYERNGYDYKSLFQKHFYKEKYGFILEAQDSVVDLQERDAQNERILLKAIRRVWYDDAVYHSLPIYTGHIMKEVIQRQTNMRCFFSVDDQMPILLRPVENVPVGVRIPLFGAEISPALWNRLMRARVSLQSLDQKDHAYLYLVKYWPNKKLKYLVRYDVRGQYVSYQDARLFSLYDRNGVLRRSHYLSYGQGVFEFDYYYRGAEIYKIVQKVLQDNQLVYLAFFRRFVREYVQSFSSQFFMGNTAVFERLKVPAMREVALVRARGKSG